MAKFVIHLSSGAAIDVVADKVEITYSTSSGNATGWKIEGARKGGPVYLNPNHIIGLEQVA